MWYYVAGIVMMSHLTDILMIGEKVYKLYNGIYYVVHCGKNFIFPVRPKQIEASDDEWIELKSFRDEECQTIDFKLEIRPIDIDSID